jgi:hypothetical protein
MGLLVQLLVLLLVTVLFVTLADGNKAAGIVC